MIVFRRRPLVIIIVFVVLIGLFVIALFTLGHDINSYIVFSDSMLPSLNTGDIVLVIKQDRGYSSFANLKLADIIVFRPHPTASENEAPRTVVHRVVDIEDDSNGSKVIRTKGDANPHSIQGLDFPITEENYIGRVTYTIPHLGVLLMYFDVLIRVFLQPLFYIIICAVIAVFLVLNLKKGEFLSSPRD